MQKLFNIKFRNFIITLTVALLPCYAFPSNAKEATTQATDSKALQTEVEVLSKRMNTIEYSLEKQKEIIDQENSAINNSIDASNRNLDVFAFILAIGGVLLGWYISRKEKSMQKLMNSVTQKECEIVALKNEIETTTSKIAKINDDINNDIEGLYQRLRREETVSYLQRLTEVPEDIGNLSEYLLARTLYIEDFEILLKAYNRLMSESPVNAKLDRGFEITLQERYLLLFFQNFCGKSMMIQELKTDLLKFLSTALDCAFKIDVQHSLNSLINTLNTQDINGENEKILLEYIISLYRSRHKDYTEPYQTIVDKCNDSINLKSVWAQLVEKGIVIEAFGNLLCARYKDDTEFTVAVKENLTPQKQNNENTTESTPQH